MEFFIEISTTPEPWMHYYNFYIMISTLLLFIPIYSNLQRKGFRISGWIIIPTFLGFLYFMSIRYLVPIYLTVVLFAVVPFGAALTATLFGIGCWYLMTWAWISPSL